MSPFVQFQIVNPEPQDPLQLVVETGRGAIVSRSSTRARAFALDLAKTIIRTTGQTLILIDSPAVHHSLRLALADTPSPLTWQLLDPQRLDVVRVWPDDCFLLANHAVAVPHSRAGRALLGLVRRSRSALVMMRPHDLEETPDMTSALGHASVNIDDGWPDELCAEPASDTLDVRTGPFTPCNRALTAHTPTLGPKVKIDSAGAERRRDPN